MDDKEFIVNHQAFTGEDRLRGIIPIADLDIHAPFLKQPFGNIAPVSVEVAPAPQLA